MFANPQPIPPASVQAKPQPIPAARPATPLPKKEEPEKDASKKKEEGVSIRPNFLLCALFQALNVLALICIFIFGLWMVKNLFKVDVVETVRLAFSSLAEGSEANGGYPLFGMLLQEMQQTVVFAFLEIIVVVFILQIPVVNNQWKLFSDRLEYRKGFILLRTNTLSFSDVKSVSFKRYTPLADFGKVVLEFSGQEGRSIDMPYVYHAARLTAELNSRVRQYQLKEAAVMAKKAQDGAGTSIRQRKDSPVQQP